jgi:hypothetical protein
VRRLQQFLIDQNIGEKGKKLKNFGITGYFG